MTTPNPAAPKTLYDKIWDAHVVDTWRKTAPACSISTGIWCMR